MTRTPHKPEVPSLTGHRQTPLHHRQSGFVLLSVLFLVALIVLSLAVAAPRVAEDIRRDRELEYYHRGLQYQRAIKLYYRKFGSYPASIDQLENTNEIRFLRRRYKDPITGKDEWRLIHVGEAKVPPMGLFGQPHAAATGITPASALGSNPADATTTNIPSTQNATGTSQPGSSSSSDSAGAGANIGGGLIIGVSSNSTKESIRVYKNQTHYNEWEFVYNPIEDQGIQSGASSLPTSGPGSPTQNGPSGPGGNAGGPGFQQTPNYPGPSSPPATPTTPPETTPQ